MSGKDTKKDPQKPAGKQRTNPWLIVALLLAIAYALFSLLVVNKELAYDPAQRAGNLPQKYKVPPTDISRSTMRTETIPQYRRAPQRSNVLGIPAWNVWVRLEDGTAGRHNIIVYAQTIYDKPVEVEEFEVYVSRIGDEKQILSEAVFAQTGPGEYTASVTLPDNGEWEVRGKFKKGLEVILIAQKIKALKPANQ